MSLHHFSVLVPPNKSEDLITFLKASLAHLDFKEFQRPVPGMVGMGTDRPYLWVDSYHVVEEADINAVQRMLDVTHVAFKANNVEEVRKFHEEGLKAGGKCNGPPGPRPEYAEGYYAAFVRDPACNINFEVACRV
ncbi:hypothetical protein H2200_000973 [Cladophialophora chaetospira]|uniref:VOC domain-containing protein n=1 Tax=Cladophialophora chaetospira TaxID=386627 RepID=A0AA38XPK9_9EURO|nr:hypothetical protein H2200_000973 [Cladophialophora chaetospira]